MAILLGNANHIVTSFGKANPVAGRLHKQKEIPPLNFLLLDICLKYISNVEIIDKCPLLHKFDQVHLEVAVTRRQ